MDLKQLIGSTLMVGFQGTKPEEIHDVLAKVRNKHIGAVILFAHNIDNPEQLKTLNSALKNENPDLIIAIDQEGGVVQRLTTKKGFVETCSAYHIENPQKSYEIMAKQLANLGFNLNFAPIVDLHDKKSSIIGQLHRAFSSDPKKVAANGEILIKAHHKFKIATCLKHFPGHGKIFGDSHLDLYESTGECADQELLPYKLIKDSNFIMTAHIIRKDLDQNHPVTLSHKILKQLLRQELQYQNAIISDDLFMGAIMKKYKLEESLPAALKAGCNMLILSFNQALKDFIPRDFKIDDIIKILEDSVRSGAMHTDLLEESIDVIKQSML